MVVVAAVAVSTVHHIRTQNDTDAAAVTMNCTLVVPVNPLSAQGLATSYRLTATNPADGPCNEAYPNQTAFVRVRPSTRRPA